MAAFEYITVDGLNRQLAADPELLLVNGYDDRQQWEDSRIPRAISWMEFLTLKDTLDKSRQIVLYCA
jgi:hypothetical protein